MLGTFGRGHQHKPTRGEPLCPLYSMTCSPESEHMMCVYILHFSEPLGNTSNPKGAARHYTGSCSDERLEQRLLEHRSGYGAKLTRAAIERGITLELGATLPGAYDEERAVKLQHNGPRHCRFCQEARLLEKMGL